MAERFDGSPEMQPYRNGDWVRYSDYAALEAEIAALKEALAWYGEQARLARLIHSGGDTGRHALAEDGGRRARALTQNGRAGE